MEDTVIQEPDDSEKKSQDNIFNKKDLFDTTGKKSALRSWAIGRAMGSALYMWPDDNDEEE